MELLDREKSGSSPRVRGKLEAVKSQEAKARLIPACAGKTKIFGPNRRGAGAHPRVCGENRAANVRLVEQMGSSPRVRGKRVFGPTLTPLPGLIPTCAGKTVAL